MARPNISRRLLAVVCACALVLSGMLALTGCDNSEQVIRSDIDTLMSDFQNPTADSLKTGMDDDAYQSLADTLAAYDTTPEEFFKHATGGMTYAINEVDVDGDKATVRVGITNKSMSDAVETVVAEYTSGDKLAWAQRLYASGGENALVKAIIQDVYDELDSSTKTVTTNVTLSLTRTDGTWDVDESSVEDFVSALYGSDLSALTSQ